MNYTMELFLFVVLLYFLYQKSPYINAVVSSPLGKLFLLILLVSITHLHGLYSGTIFLAIIFILMNNVYEGMEVREENNDKENTENNENETEKNEVNMNEQDNEMNEDNNQQEEKETENKDNNDLIENDPSDLRNKDKMVENPDAAGAVNKKDEPKAVGNEKHKKTIEGFSVYN